MPTPPPIPVILNPSARSARAGERADTILALSSRVEIHATGGPGDARRFARDLALAGAPVVVAAGGDGTINEVVNGIALAGPECRTALGILPSGTMNVFAGDLGLPAARLDECWSVIEAGHVRSIDLWLANDEYFVQLAGAGLDASVIAGTTWERKKKYGPVSYVIGMVEVMRRGSPMLTVTAPGRNPLEGRVVLIGNGIHYGGPFRLFPQASFTDGLLDVMVMRNHSLLNMARLSMAAASGRYSPRLRDITYFQTPELDITCAETVPFQADGELSGNSPVKFRLAPFPLRVLA
ncbi:MAG TPA: diacylglycerol kinase family protein [Verrucomicrobiales bacterium]|nr:diacylglycerol kinase family protein [Verrucomicrobiales bacterium]